MEELTNQVKKRFEAYHFPGHDFKHVTRVSHLARQIAEAEGYDAQEAAIAGLLHDVGRTIEHLKDTHAHDGAPLARQLMNDYTDLSEEVKERIEQAIYVHSDKFTTGTLNNILQDADKLDGIGAIGISRVYMSFPNTIDYHPDDLFPKAQTYGKYTSIYQAIMYLLDWYGMLYTDKAKEIGKPRQEFLQQYVQKIIKEIEESS